MGKNFTFKDLTIFWKVLLGLAGSMTILIAFVSLVYQPIGTIQAQSETLKTHTSQISILEGNVRIIQDSTLVDQQNYKNLSKKLDELAENNKKAAEILNSLSRSMIEQTADIKYINADISELKQDVKEIKKNNP